MCGYSRTYAKCVLAALMCLTVDQRLVVAFTSLSQQRIHVPSTPSQTRGRQRAPCESSSFRRRPWAYPSCIVVNVKSEEENDDDDDVIQSEERLKDAISDLLQSASRGLYEDDVRNGSLETYSVPDLEDPSSFESQRRLINFSRKQSLPEQEDSIEAASIDEESLQDAVERQFTNHASKQQQGPNVGISGDSAATLSEGFEMDSDGMFLDTEDYLHSRDWLNSDGSLSLPGNETAGDDFKKLTEVLLEPPPKAPDSMYSTRQSRNKEPSLEDLIKQPRIDPHATSEEMHRKVFEGEEGYLQQSEIFRQALTDQSAQRKALEWRRGARYRERQANLLSQLDQEIQDFEDNLLDQQQTSPPKQHQSNTRVATCSQCGGKLSNEEMLRFREAKSKRFVCQVCNAQEILQGRASNMTTGPVAKAPETRIRPSAPPRAKAQQQRAQDKTRSSVSRKQPPVARAKNTDPIKSSLKPKPTASDTEDDTNQTLMDQVRQKMDQMRQLESQLEEYKQQAEGAQQQISELYDVISGMEGDLRSAMQQEQENSYSEQELDGASPIEQQQSTRTSDPWVKGMDSNGETINWNRETDEFVVE